MNASADRSSVILFGPFEFEAQSGVLRRQGKQIPLQPKPARILALLVARASQVVTRDEIRDVIWSEDTFVDFEHSINFSIRQIRIALHDVAEKPRFIETLPRRGYRFLPSIERISREGRDSIRSLAVLPLVNLSRDPEQEYFADGMTDQLITELARAGSLRVISRTSVQCYKRTRKSLPEIARRLDVDALVEGTILRSGQRVRITVQLIAARKDDHLWAESYERDFEDVFKLQAEVAQAIAEKVHARLTREPGQRSGTGRPVASVAFDCVLRGRYFWNKRGEENIHRGIGYFRQAIEADPTYAVAYAGMAESYMPLGYWGYNPPGETFPKAKAWAAKALEIDKYLPEAHAALSSVHFIYERDLESAEKEALEAIRLNPNCARARQVYAEFLTSMGEFGAAADQIRQALESDPLSPVLYFVDAQTSYFARRYEEALAKCRKSIEVEPAFPVTHYMLGLVSERLGRFKEAVGHLKKACELTPQCSWFQAELGQAYALCRMEDEARSVLQCLENRRNERYVPAYSIAGMYAGLADRERTLVWLDRANEERSARMMFLNVDPAFDALYPDPRFRELLRRAALPARG